jgi:FtsZ-interacting cell division protein ZipA
MLGAIIAIAIVVLLVVGFWWTRGGGGVPGGIDDPARQELPRFDELGDPVEPPGLEREDREHEIE